MKRLLTLNILLIFACAKIYAQGSAVTNAILYFDDKEYDKAKEYIDKATVHAKTSTKSKTWFWSGQIHHELGKKNGVGEHFKIANKSYAKAIEINDSGSMVSGSKRNKANLYNDVLNLAFKKYQAKELDAALSLYETGMDIAPEDSVALNYGTIVAIGQKEYDKVIAFSDKWIALKQKTATPYLNKVDAYTAKKEDEKALTAADEGIKLFPNNKMLISKKIDRLIILKRVEEAIPGLEKTLELEPNNALAMSNLGIIYNEMNQPAKAVEYFEKAVAANPKNEDANYMLGSHYFNKAADMYNEDNDMSLSNYQKYGKKKEAEAKALIVKSIPYFEAVRSVNDRDLQTVQSLLTAYQKTDQLDKADEMSKILSGN